jgi:WD40 repeat protein
VPRLVATDNQLLVGMGKTGVHLIDPFTGNAIQALEESGDWIRPCGSADGKTLFAHSVSNEVRLWDLPSRTLTHRWQLAQPVESLAISADGRLAAVVTSNLEQILFTIYEMKTGTITREFRQPLGVARAAISPNGEHFALTLNDTFSLWNLKSDSRQGPFQGPFGSISEVDFSPDGRVLAIASGNRTIKLWDVASASWIASLEGHRHAVRGVQFLANGKTIMSWDISGFGFWDVETGQQFYIHQIGKSPHDIFTTSAQRFKKLYSLVISPDQSWLASSGMGISTSILDLSMDE